MEKLPLSPACTTLRILDATSVVTVTQLTQITQQLVRGELRSLQLVLLPLLWRG